MKYSKKKFESFSTEKQHKTLKEFIKEIHNKLIMNIIQKNVSNKELESEWNIKEEFGVMSVMCTVI